MFEKKETITVKFDNRLAIQHHLDPEVQELMLAIAKHTAVELRAIERKLDELRAIITSHSF